MNWNLGIAVLVAAFMGLAAQRGGTCTVAAVEEIVHKRRAHRFLAMFTTAIWVIALIQLARAMGQPVLMPLGFEASAMVVVGGAVLGFGAYVNRACVLGSVARLGSGDWAYLAMPVGFFFGALLFSSVLPPMAPDQLIRPSPVTAVPVWLLVSIAVFAAWQMRDISGAGRVGLSRRSRLGRAFDAIWTPPHATILIGTAFVVILLLVDDAWTYTDALIRLSKRAGEGHELWRLALYLALLAGAVAGGISSGRFSNTRPSISRVTRSFLGGLIMAAGSLLIPGSNDGLLLFGLPMLWPYAWLAFASMCSVLVVASTLAARRQPRSKNGAGN